MSIIALKIDVSKIDKKRLFTGKKGVYLDAVLFLNDIPDEFGNYGMITQSVTMDERAAGLKGTILGNCKLLKSSRPTQQAQVSNAPVETPANETDDDLPF